MSDKFLLTIYKQPATVFTFKDIGLLFPGFSYQSLKNRVQYALKSGGLQSLRRGIYAKDGYNPLELANKIYTPSYISLETVLAQAGVIFQVYETIFAVAYLTRRIKVDGHEVFYRKVKDRILSNSAGIEEKETYSIAGKERAFLDALFLYKDYHFDNLTVLDWDKIFKLQEIYGSKALKKRVQEYYHIKLKND